MEAVEQTILRLRRRERVRELRHLIIISSSWLSIPLFFVFSIADYFYAPNKFLALTLLRLLIVPSCLLVNYAVKRTRNLLAIQTWGAFYAFANAFLITVMTILTGGKSSGYYAGLNLCAISAGSFIPWTPAALACNLALIYLPFFAWSFWTWRTPGNSIFIAHSLFMAATVVITLVVRGFNEKYRMSAIRSRVALHQELERRAEIIQEKTAEAIHLQEQFRQSQKMESMGRLAGGIAHDFNNLLMVIQSYTEMLQDHLPPEDRSRKNTQQVLKAAGRATNLTRQMLAFSRKQMLSPVVLDLNALLDDTARMMQRLIGEDIEFRVFPSPSLGPIEADSDQIVQVVMNLCVNARDAMEHGGTLTIATENISSTDMPPGERSCVAPGEYVKLSVADTGFGISKELQEQIFEPFFTTKPNGKGTGLGLATVYGIVTQSGGHIGVQSEVGLGTCFTVYLPRAKQAATASGSAAKPQARPRGRETILVAEDEDSLREAICDYMRTLGYTVLAASSGPHALALAGEHQGSIDLLISDVVMPKMSGRALSETLVRMRPNVKTIYMSGYTDDAVLRLGVKKLGAAFLQKPFSLSTLAREVRTMLGRTVTVQ